MARPHIVIVGAGFGGLHAALSLRKSKARVTLIDRQNHHLFQPLLYQVATAGLSPADIAEPIRRILRRQKNVTVLLGEVKQVDLSGKKLILGDGELAYDALILACGASHSFFGNDSWAEHAHGLKSLDDALAIRRRILLSYEQAERHFDDEARRDALLSFVVIGGGPTGVELAGSLAEIARRTLAKDFRRIDPTLAQVTLIEAGPRLLSAFDPALSERTRQSLSEMGVTVMTDTRVTKIDDGVVEIGDKSLRAATILWAAGVAGAPVAKTLGSDLDRVGRVVVGKDCALPDHPEVFAIGDMASCIDAEGKTIPGLCQGAIQMGKVAAHNAEVHTSGSGERREVVYRDLGIMATIGRASAVVELPFLKFSGFIAWLVWSFLHIALLIGFDNRALVMIEWIWAYVSFDRGARLITQTTPTTPS